MQSDEPVAVAVAVAVIGMSALSYTNAGATISRRAAQRREGDGRRVDGGLNHTAGWGEPIPMPPLTSMTMGPPRGRLTLRH